MARIYCIKCGKKIESNYFCCPFCGNAVPNDITEDGRSNFLTRCFNFIYLRKEVFHWITLVLISILSFFTVNYYSYYEALIEILIIIFSVIALHVLYKYRDKASTVINLILSVLLITLIVIFLYKHDAVYNTIPNNGDEIYISYVSYDDFYSDEREGDYVYNPEPYYFINGKRAEKIEKIIYGESAITEIGCTYNYNSKYGEFEKGNVQVDIPITADIYLADEPLYVSINIDKDVIADIGIKLSRKVPFWSVILQKNTLNP